MSKLETFIRKHYTDPLWCKTLFQSKKIRILCDGGYPIFRYYPVIIRTHYDKYWNMYGFSIYWLGRQIMFSFGEDHHKLYEENK